MASTREIAAIAGKSLTLIWRDRVRLFALLLFPIIIVVFFGYSVQNFVSKVPFGIVCNDENPQICLQIAQAMQSSTFFDVSHRYGTENELKKAIDVGEVQGGVIIPFKTTENIQNNQQAVIYIIMDESKGSTASTLNLAAEKIISMGGRTITLQFLSAEQRAMKQTAQNLASDAEKVKRLRQGLQSLNSNRKGVFSSLEAIAKGNSQKDEGFGAVGSALEELAKQDEIAGQSYLLTGADYIRQGMAAPSIGTFYFGFVNITSTIDSTSGLVSSDTSMSDATKGAVLYNLAYMRLAVGGYISGLNALRNATMNESLARNTQQSYTSLGYVYQSMGNGQLKKAQIERELAAKLKAGSLSANEIQLINILLQMNENENKVVQSLAGIEQGLNLKKDALLKLASSDALNAVEPLALKQKDMYGTGLGYLDFFAPGIIAFVTIFGSVMSLGRAIAGERELGQLTRLFLTPVDNISIMVGNALAYGSFEMLRAVMVLVLTMALFNMHVKGSLFLLFMAMFLNVVAAVGLGLIISSQVKNSEQFMQIAQVVIMPMQFISGIFFPVESMPKWIQPISYLSPMYHSAEILRGIIIKGFGIAELSNHILFMLGFVILMVVLSTVMFKREVV